MKKISVILAATHKFFAPYEVTDHNQDGYTFIGGEILYTKKIYFSGEVAELQDIFEGVKGVLKVTAGFIDAQNVISYANREPRSIENFSGAEIEFNPKKTDISTLLDILFNNLNPYEKNNLGVYYSSGEDAPQVELHMNFVANKGKCPATTGAALIMNDPNSNPRLTRQCYVNFGRLKKFNAANA